MNKKFFKFSIVAMIVVMALALVPVATVDAGTTMYSGDITGGASWDRPFSDCSGISGLGPVTYEAQQFYVDTAGTYDFSSIQSYDGYLLLYIDPFDPTNQLNNCLGGDDDGGGGIGTSDFSFALTANTTYVLVMTAFANGDVGTYTNTISGPGNIVLGPYAPAPAAMNIPHNGLVLINSWEPTVAYDGPAGSPVRLSGGGILTLPNDADANGFDTYIVTETATVDGATWVALFIGNETWVWVPWSAVHPASYFPE